jgi:DNA-binding GntR family transcriptional regulator
MSQPGTFDRVYAAIKERLRSGAYRPGQRLEPAALSDELNASVTPVRDALHRLTGERLVDAPRHEGFRVPMMTEARLRQLYAWHLDLLLLALLKHRSDAPADPAADPARPGEQAHDREAALFLLLAGKTRNAEHVAAIRSVTEKLEPFQRAERTFLDETQRETEAIAAAIEARDRTVLRRHLVQYFRRRERIVPEILASLQRSD